MLIRECESAKDHAAYDAFVLAHPHASLWQSSAWMTYEESCGRTVKRFGGFVGQTILIAALVSIDRTAFGASTWTVQRGPLWNASLEADDIQVFLQFLQDAAKKDGAMSLFLSPTAWDPVVDLPEHESRRHIVPQATTVIDLTQSEEDILKAMHQKGRYNIGVAQRNGVTVEASDAIDAFYTLLQSTGGRDGFRIKQKGDYRAFMKMPHAFLLMAYEPTSKKPIAGLLGVFWNKQALYYYGASDYAYRALMAPYLLQWTAIQRAKAVGCILYDFLGIAPLSAPANDPWQGITEFKKKFGGKVIEFPPEREIVLRPFVRAIIRGKRKILG
jgi:lipid II:glycine glycyltransferase (peptidoglycan interpeptide bridge formation enzyme)